MEILTDQNSTDRLITAMAVYEFFSKNRADKKEPTGIEIKMGENIAIPNDP